MAASARSVHLVGTIPAESARAAFGLVDEVLGDTLGPLVPDGETGDRLDWVVRIVQGLRENPDLRLKRDGGFTSESDSPVFRVRRGHRFESVSLDYVEAFRESWPLFQAFRDDGHPGVSLQVGIPGHLDLAFVSFGFALLPGLRALRPFREATVSAIEHIHAVAGDGVVFQLEVPGEVVILTRLPRFLRRLAASRLAKEAVKVVEESPEGSRFGVHLCFGDLNHQSETRVDDAGPLVDFTRALVKRWPDRRRLEFVHAPLAVAATPPPVERSYYEPLQGLDLPDGVRFVAGFIHEGRRLDELIGIRDTIEAIMGQPVDVAASCGLGRRDPAAARRNLELSREVAVAGS